MDQQSSKEKCQIEEVGLQFNHDLPSAYSPQPHHTQPASRTVEIERNNWKCSRYRVIDGTTQIYAAKMSLHKPQMTIENSDTSEPLSTVIFHSHTSRIDITVHGESTALVSHGICMNKWTYTSPALQTTITWKRKNMMSKMFDFVCLQEEVPIAQFTAKNLGVTRIGKINFFGDRASNGVAMDEIVTTGLALADFWLVQMTVPGLALISSAVSVQDKAVGRAGHEG